MCRTKSWDHDGLTGLGSDHLHLRTVARDQSVLSITHSLQVRLGRCVLIGLLRGLSDVAGYSIGVLHCMCPCSRGIFLQNILVVDYWSLPNEISSDGSCPWLALPSRNRGSKSQRMPLERRCPLVGHEPPDLDEFSLSPFNTRIPC